MHCRNGIIKPSHPLKIMQAEFHHPSPSAQVPCPSNQDPHPARPALVVTAPTAPAATCLTKGNIYYSYGNPNKGAAEQPASNIAHAKHNVNWMSTCSRSEQCLQHHNAYKLQIFGG